MTIPSPKQVFDDPTEYWTFLTQNADDAFEGQHFDRKEVGQIGIDQARLGKQLKSVRDEIKETISAFANANREGGLLVLGIASDGTVNGIDYLSEQQKNSLTDLTTLLHHQAAEAKFHQGTDAHGGHKTICLIFVPYTDNSICETPERTPKAWTRSGAQNVLMTPEVRERIRNDKGLVNFEITPCCLYDPDDVSRDVLTEFRKVFHPDSTHEFTDERVLYEAGAIVQRSGGYWFTHAGLLFFASNPQRVLSQSHIRLLRFSVSSDQFQERGLPTLISRSLVH